MAKKKTSTLKIIVCSLLSLIVGIVMGAFASFYLGLPATQTVPETKSKVGIDVDVVKSSDLSIHFLELGNKYTGDCTFIDVGEVEILIDAGSKSSSIPVIDNYISNYVDGILDYVIVTHAHQDHYAGFATGKNTQSLFDIYDVGTVIKFANTNQAEDAQTYSNFKRELQELEQKMEDKGETFNLYTAMDCINGQREFNLGSNISLEILYHKFYEQKTSNENDYSVCCQINQNNEKYYLFTGDLDADGETSLVTSVKNQGYLHQVELFKAGHHGSGTSSNADLLEVIRPKTVCVCCCAGSSEYTDNQDTQFPTQEFIDRISIYTDKIYVTTLCLDYKNNQYQSFNGNIVVCSSNDKVKVYCSYSIDILKNSDWFKQNRVTPQAWQ